MEVRLLQGLTGSLSRALGRRAQLEMAVREVIVEVAFVWAHFQLVSKPAGALDEQIVFFGRAGTLEGIQGMLRGKRRLRELERWEILFAGVVHAQAYCDRYADHEIRRVEVPFAGKSLPGYLHLPPNRSERSVDRVLKGKSAAARMR